MSRSLKDVAAEVQRCVYAWEHDARIIGNVTAVELRLLIRERDALITRLRAAEAALPSTTEIYAIEEARSAIESSCDVYCDEIDAWLSRVGEARALLPAAPEAPHG